MNFLSPVFARVIVVLLGMLATGRADGDGEWAGLEARHGGRLGVAMVDRFGKLLLSHRGGERFAMCSTFKLLLAGAVAAKVDAGTERWERVISYQKENLLSWSPVTGRKAALENGGMSVEGLCEASMIWSDNTAANLLLPVVGGPEGLTLWLRGTGDAVTRMDRIEPELNSNDDGDLRDTSTPETMAATVARLAFGTTLSKASRDRLAAWLLGNRTGDARIRAGMQPGWRVGDKTGTGENGAANDVGIVWPGEEPPLILVIFCDVPDAEPPARDRLIADAARALMRKRPEVAVP